MVGGAQLQLPRDKKEAFEAIAKYYACEAKIGAKIMSYGAGKSDVGISYMAAVRLCNELLEPLGGWPAELIGLGAE